MGTADQGGNDGRATAHPGIVARTFAQRSFGAGQFQGVDGLAYESAPVAVPGLDGELFYGADFDVACGIGGGTSSAMQMVSKLAKVIEKSGRRVIWTAAPSKTSVLADKIDRDALPHGACDEFGLAAQQQVVDSVKDRNFLPLRQRLAKDPRQMYFKTDPHWTTVGASVFARAVAGELSAKVARAQRYSYGTETRVGLFNSLRGIDTPELAETAVPAGKVTVRTAKGSVEDWAGYPDLALDHAWDSSPRQRTWPGRTLLLGDSFMMFALESMRPVFRHGRFIWVDHVDRAHVIQAIKQSDTVVIEVLQTFLPLGQPLVDKSFRSAVRRALN